MGIGAASLFALFFFFRRDDSPRLSPWLRWPLVLLPCYALLQILPLPASVLSIISPSRAGLLRALHSVASGSEFGSISVFPSETTAYLFRILACLALFLIVREIDGRLKRQPWAIVAPIVVVAALEAALGIWQSATGVDAAHGTYVNRDHYAGLLEMALPFAVMYPIAVMRRPTAGDGEKIGPVVRACIGLSIAVLILTGIISSLSRMGYVAGLFSLLVIGTLAAGAELSRRQRWIAAAGVAALVLALFVFLPPNELIARFGDIASSDKITGDDRVAMWRDTLHLVSDYPLFGCGLGGFVSALQKYQAALPLNTVDYAHNDVLQTLAEMGGVGFLLVVVFLGAVFTQTLRALSSLQNDRRYRAFASVGAIAAICLHSLVDFNLHIPANGLVLAWICAVAVSGSPTVREGVQEPEVRRAVKRDE